MLNSCPLIHVSIDLRDEEGLTPNRFLFGLANPNFPPTFLEVLASDVSRKYYPETTEDLKQRKCVLREALMFDQLLNCAFLMFTPNPKLQRPRYTVLIKTELCIGLDVRVARVSRVCGVMLINSASSLVLKRYLFQ